jgi:glycosyltransferase involved in cell wall biosynthesis
VKIVVVSDVSPVRLLGGGERVLWEQTSRLSARDHVVRVVSRTPEGGASGDLVHGGVAVHHFPVDRRSLTAFIRTSVFGARRAVESAVAVHGADVLHFHQPIGAFGVLTSPLGRRLPSLYTFHSPAPLEYRSRRGMSGLHRGGLVGRVGAVLLQTLERVSLNRVSRIQVLSDFSARLLWNLYGISGDRIVKIVGGADVERFRPNGSQEAQRRTLGLPGDRPLLFTLRNLEPRMGLDALIRAMATVRERFPRVLLLIGGSGSLRPLLETLTISLDLSDHVRFLGFVPERDLPAHYGAADAFVLPTRELEGFGLVTVEALACGTPVLGTPIGATPEILEPLDRSLVFADSGPTSIADGICRFLERSERDPEAVRGLRRACVSYAERQYGWDRSVDALEDVLGTLTAKDVVTIGAVRCAACDAAAPLRRFRHRGEEYRSCPGCGTSVVAKLPTVAGLRHFYETEYPARSVSSVR